VKFKLDIQETADHFFEDVRILGIVAPVKDYQFCWQINQSLRLDFRVNNDLEIQLSKKSRQYFFSIFEYAEPVGSLRHFLYNNQFDAPGLSLAVKGGRDKRRGMAGIAAGAPQNGRRAAGNGAEHPGYPQ
jgi:hypothetical protein